MGNLVRLGSPTAEVAVVEIRKVQQRPGTGFDTRALSLLGGTFKDAGYSWNRVASYSLTFTTNEERNAELGKLFGFLKNHKIVISLGAMAMQALCQTKKTIGEYAGSLTWNDTLNIWVIPSYHPSSVVYGPRETMNKRFDEFDFLYDHVHRTVDLLTGKLDWPNPETRMDPCPRIFVGHNGVQIQDGDLAKSWSGYWESTEEEAIKAIRKFSSWLAKIEDSDSPVIFSLDTESRGLNPLQFNAFTMIQVYDGEEAWAFNSGVVKHPSVLHLVQEFLTHPNVRFVLHNTQHDRKVIWHALSVSLEDRDVDTLALALGITEKGSQTGLKYLSRQYLNAPFYEEALDQWLDPNATDYSHIPPDVLANYGNLDVYYTYHLMPILAQKVQKEGTGKSVRELLLPAQRVFAEMGYEGITTDLDYCERMSAEWDPKIKAAIKRVQDYARSQGFPNNPNIVKGASYKVPCKCVPVKDTFKLEGARCTSYRKILREAGVFLEECSRCEGKRYITKYDTTLNVNSSSHMQHLCFDILGMRELPFEGRTTKKGFWKLNANHELAQMVAEYKELQYLQRNFLDAMQGFVKEDGRVHPNFLLFGTKTGRLSVREPAMQTVPKHGSNAKVVRKAFKPDDEDSLIVDIDYKSLEMFIAHHLTKDPTLLEVLLGEWDAHTALAAKIYNKPPELVTPEERQSVKPVNFGAGYGISGFKLSLDPAMEKATGGDKDKAQKFLDEFWDMYSTWSATCETWKRQALTEQYLMTEMGRKRRWNLITPENISKVKNQAMNFKGQSLASDLCLSSLLTLHPLLKEKGWGRVLLSVHDSLVFSLKKATIHEAISVICEIMTTPPFETDTPFAVDVELGPNYGEKEPYNPETDYTTWQFVPPAK